MLSRKKKNKIAYSEKIFPRKKKSAMPLKIKQEEVFLQKERKI